MKHVLEILSTHFMKCNEHAQWDSTHSPTHSVYPSANALEFIVAQFTSMTPINELASRYSLHIVYLMTVCSLTTGLSLNMATIIMTTCIWIPLHALVNPCTAPVWQFDHNKLHRCTSSESMIARQLHVWKESITRINFTTVLLAKQHCIYMNY